MLPVPLPLSFRIRRLPHGIMPSRARQIMQHLVNLVQEGDLISISINAFSPIRIELRSTRTATLWII